MQNLPTRYFIDLFTPRLQLQLSKKAFKEKIDELVHFYGLSVKNLVSGYEIGVL